MRASAGGVVAVLGAIIAIAGAVALFNYRIVADETGISGWNPALWVVFIAGLLTLGLGCMQFVSSMNAVPQESWRHCLPAPFGSRTRRPKAGPSPRH